MEMVSQAWVRAACTRACTVTMLIMLRMEMFSRVKSKNAPTVSTTI